MNLFIKSVCASLVLLLNASQFFAQSGSPVIPELVFQNPVLVSGTAGKDGAIYRFNNVATDVDATVRITRRSSAAVVLTNIDVANLGWAKAFQPQLGIPGNVSPDQNWWMEFEMKFLRAGTNAKKKIKSFNVTALDVDGDGYYIQEYVQMNKVKAVTCSPVTYLYADDAFTIPWLINLLSDMSGYNLDGIDKKMQGPKQNFMNIDTVSTGVMSTYSYEDKDVISFVIGAKSSGGVSNAGERLNSLWFKTFNLAPVTQRILPVKLTSFNTLLDDNNVTLSWSSATEENFSHYVIERSADGKNYKDVALVFAAGNSGSVLNYSYKDKNVVSSTGVVYYRLRLVEQTKEVSYSQIRTVKFGRETESVQLTVYPNPVKNDLRVILPVSLQGKSLQIELFTATGSKVKSMKISSASQTENINVNNISSGTYLLKVICEGKNYDHMIIKS